MKRAEPASQVDVAGKGAASWVRFRGKQAALVPQVGGPLNSVVDVFSGVHPLPRTTDGMASPGLLQDVQVRSLVVKDPACCVLQPKKKKASKAAAPTQHSIHNVWVT